MIASVVYHRDEPAKPQAREQKIQSLNLFPRFSHSNSDVSHSFLEVQLSLKGRRLFRQSAAGRADPLSGNLPLRGGKKSFVRNPLESTPIVVNPL